LEVYQLKNNNNVLAIRLKKLREKSGLTQKKVAATFGLTNFQLSRYESGQSNPDPDLIAKFADFYEVSADYLLGLTDDPTPATRDKLKKLGLKENEEIHFFNLEGLSDEDIEFIKNQIEFLRKKAKQQRKDTE
jgi:transcriptional regulator with XRE-family HTH domain